MLSRTGAPAFPRLLAPLTRVSCLSHTNAMIKPRSSPASSPLGRMIFFLGLLAVPGGVALVMIEPPEFPAA